MNTSVRLYRGFRFYGHYQFNSDFTQIDFVQLRTRLSSGEVRPDQGFRRSTSSPQDLSRARRGGGPGRRVSGRERSRHHPWRPNTHRHSRYVGDPSYAGCLGNALWPDVLGAGLIGERGFDFELAGLTCLAGDVIGRYSLVSPLQLGQRLVFSDMAQYTMVKANTFNGVRLPSITVSTGLLTCISNVPSTTRTSLGVYRIKPC